MSTGERPPAPTPAPAGSANGPARGRRTRREPDAAGARPPSGPGADAGAGTPVDPTDELTTSVLRLTAPGTVEGILSSPAGPRVGVFLDFDGTLMAGYSAAVFGKHRLRSREVGSREILQMGQLYLQSRAGRADFAAAMALTAMAWQGRTDDELHELGQQLYDREISGLVFPEMRALVQAHQRRGHTVVLNSSATEYQIGPVARALGIEDVICSRLEVVDGRLTGGLVGALPWGPGKADAVQRFAADHAIDLAQSYAYADGDEDAALLHLVGHPRAVNPASGLAKVAERRGWPVLRFTSRGGGSLGRVVRNAAGIAAVLPAAVGGAVVGLVNRDKRTGVDVAFPMWVDLLLGINSVKVRAVGIDNAWGARPAVFIFNHVNNFDAFIVAKVLRGGVSGVGKKELGKSPLSAFLAWALDAALIDRSDSASAVEALRPVTERLARGISVSMSPEGTRSESGEIGEFKKGAFRMAMQAGVPVVPVVLRNADVLGSRNSATLRAGTVDIAVLPPVPTADWTLEDLPERIEEIRRSFLATLADWPQGGILL
ncbi:HAD-IB family hydrolase [Trujillonella humicola]|uniref:HAD-IB family hydrolase n=1 Tax=Trujillonella humicola TaxID=3383699 RepID=UPI0039065C47